MRIVLFSLRYFLLWIAAGAVLLGLGYLAGETLLGEILTYSGATLMSVGAVLLQVARARRQDRHDRETRQIRNDKL